MSKLPKWLSPTLVVAMVLVGYLAAVLIREQGDPLAFAVIGDGFVNGQPLDYLGYDGQFAYWIARDPTPAVTGAYLDVPAYRYQRILYPLLAWALAAGQAALVPWTLVAVNLAAQLAGTWLVEQWLVAHGVSRWYALTYGLWVGLVMAVRLDLTEPLAYALAAAALLALHRGRAGWSAVAVGLGLFAKETVIAFWLALLVWALVARQWRTAGLYAAALLPFAVFQGLLLLWFGKLGLAAGGFMATPFEIVPYMGLWRIGTVSLPTLLLLGVLLVPLIVLPSVWGIVAAAWRLLQRDTAPIVWALGANAALLVVAPYSTFREPLGISRLATGLVLATVLFGAHGRYRRVLNYSLLWMAALVLAVSQ